MVAITEPNWCWREHIALAADAGLIKSCIPHLHGGRGLPVNFLPSCVAPVLTEAGLLFYGNHTRQGSGASDEH